MITSNESCYRKTNLFRLCSATFKQLYYYVQWVGHFECRNDFYIKRNHFNSFLLLYTIRGNAVLKYQGKTHHLSTKSLMLIDCRELHEYYPLDDNWEFKFLHFNGNMSQTYYNYILKLYGSPILPTNRSIEHYLDELYRLTAESGPEETCSDYIYRILVKIIHGYHLEQNVDVSPAWMTQAIEFISRNYHHEIQIDNLAQMFHFSRCYFSTQFKKHTGFSPHQYILNYRIAEAKWRLYNTTLSINEISTQCGFQNTSSFIRCFKKQEGISPLVYRKTNTLSV